MLEVQVKEETDGVKENGKYDVKERAAVPVSVGRFWRVITLTYLFTCLAYPHGFSVTPEKAQASSATSTANTPISQEESNYYKLMFGNGQLSKQDSTFCLGF